MLKKLTGSVFFCVIFLLSCLFSIKSYASHLFGADLSYAWVSGNTYKVTFTVYGDCSGTAFPTLSTSSPEIEVFDGSTLYTSFNLTLQAPTTGVEVTPVCPRDTDSTTCHGGTVPGITKFVYSGTVTLSGKSSKWIFLFDGSMNISTSAGRSGSITNISGAGTSTMQLRDTLNNMNGNNSSPTFSVIPTPFFCDNEPANYNPGAVDSIKGDSLVFKLVPGLDASSGTVSYLSGYSATSPLAVSTGSFNLNKSTGQISFKPDALQKSLVVEQVNQYHNDTLVGTIMREMTFIVLNCNNPPPNGKISNTSAGTIIDSTDMSICNSTGDFTFHINPVDADSSDITVTASGLPSGSTFTITSNGTPSPKGLFSWNTTGVAPGTYNFFLTYINDACPLSSKQTQAYSVIILPDPKLTISILSLASCIKKEVFKITPVGTDTPWNIKLYKGSIAIDSFKKVTSGSITDSLSPGTYVIGLSNRNGCYTDSILVIAPPPAIVPSFTMTLPTCVGDSNGTIKVSASGGLPPFKYSLGSGPYTTTTSYTNLTAGTYTFHIEDSNSCVKDTSVVLANPDTIHARVNFTRPPCNHFKNGSISINAYNSISPYQYALDTGSFVNIGYFDSLYSGPYTIHIKNALGCIKDTLVQLPDSLRITAGIPIINELCYGGNNGSFTINATGGYGAPYLYDIDSGALTTTRTYTSLTAGKYYIHIQDTVLCYLDTSIIITQPPLITYDNGIQNVDCYSNATGVAVVRASGGTPPYEYSKNGGPYTTSNLFTGLTAGTYIVTIKDTNGCTQNDTIKITQPPLLTITNIHLYKPLCHGDLNGYFVVTAAGGTTPYTYAVNTSGYSSNDTLNGLGTGTYTIHVKDSNGCVKDSIMFLPEPTAIAVSASVTKSVCATLSNGQVILYPSGGTPGYTFAVDAGSYDTTATFNPLTAGLHTFHIKDANGCIKDTIIAMTDSFKLSEKVKINDALCFDSSSGSIIVTALGGTSPYTYQLTPGSSSTTDTFSSLLSQNYTVRITDSNGCMYDSVVLVGQPPVITPSVIITSPSCYGFNNGVIIVGATGGTSPYTYALDTSAYTANTNDSNILAGVDTVHIRDSHGCNYDTVLNISQPSPMEYDSIIISNDKCFGDNSGYVTVVARGGTPAYQYAANASKWQASNVLTGLYAGNQVIYLQDSHGCTLDSTIVVTQPTQLSVAIDTLIEPTCQFYKDGRIVIGGAGGTMPYLYSNDNVTYNKDSLYANLPEGKYTLWVKDTNSCKHDTTITLTGYPHIVIDGIDVQGVNCFGQQNGKITLNISGGVQPLVYSIDGYTNVSGNVFDSVLTGTYQIVITDSKNCKKDTTVFMPQPDKIALTATVNPNECVGPDTLGQVRIDVQGGTPPYTYLWSTNPEITENKLQGMPNGNYMVWVHDAHNCVDSLITTVMYDDCCKPFIPDAFTPNGDGKNDIFRLRFKGDMKLIEFSIYNRFGQRVFYTTFLEQGWDGTFNGVPQDLGTYYYYLKAICGYRGDHTVELKGDVTLIR